MSFTNLLIIVATFFISLYVLLIYRYTFLFQRLKVFRPKKIPAVTSFSIVIPARNEEQNIGNCIQSILDNDYPKHLYEIIVVDDYSTDATAAMVEDFARQHSNIRLIKLHEILQHQQLNSYKKKAIETAIGFATHEWIITTDADCTVPKNWLHHYDAYLQKNPVYFVGAPVVFHSENTVLSVFQQLDFLTLQGITAASVSAGFHSMCNGANLAYKKSVFYEVGGFKGIDNIASGDDMLLMHKIKQRFSNKIGYLFSKGAVVHTKAMPTWKAFLNQRIRWASKSTHYTDKKVFAVLLLVYMVNLLMLVMPFCSFSSFKIFKYWVLFMVIKSSIECIFLFYVTSFFKKRKLLGWFFFMQPLHILYTVVAGLLGKAGAYTWKGRSVK